MSELTNIQRWLTSIIIKPGKLGEKIRLADQFYQLNNEKVIRPSLRSSAGEKIGIYARGYVLRLMDCMTAEYPALHHLLGEELFGTFAKAYLVKKPAASPDLYDLGKNFPDFLKAAQPENREIHNTDPSMFDLPVELAKLERAISEVSRSKGLEGMEENKSIENQMLYLFGTVSFHASPCLQLLQLQFPLVDFVQAVQQGSEAQVPDEKESFIVVSRKNYIVHVHELEQWQWHFLTQFKATGNYLESAEFTAQQCDLEKSSLMADMMLWIPVAISIGYIYADSET
ncbi:MAG: putative DNA-binding protein [Mucilaginibacter sp.]|nr:putative DNA-binding protein [Mucilaginibacter sp.]